MSWADDEDDVPCAAVPSFQQPVAAIVSQPRPSLLAPSLPERDPRGAARAVAAAHPSPHARAQDSGKSKGPQGQRDDIARIQQKLSNASGPVSTLADRMGANPWSKPAAAAGNSAPAIGTPRQPQTAAEPQRKPLVLAPRTQPLPVLPVQAQLAAAAVPAAVTPSSEPNKSSSSQPPVPSKPKSDPFGGARPVDESKAAEIRRKLQEEKVQKEALEASRVSHTKISHEIAAKQPSDKDAPRQHEDRPLSSRGGWGSRGHSGDGKDVDSASSDAGGVKILQRATEKLAISQPQPPIGGAGKGAKATTPREPKRTDCDQSAVSAPAAAKGAPQSPNLHAAAAGDGSGRMKPAPQSPNLGPAAAAVVDAAAAAARGTPSNRGKGKRKDVGGKGKPSQGADDLPLPFDN